MGMLSRMSTVVKAKMNRLIDNAEDPKEDPRLRLRKAA